MAARTPQAGGQLDRKLITATREFRDRYLEQIAQGGARTSQAKYDVSRALERPSATMKLTPAPASPKQLPEAA
jgi:hypothetical protein